MKISTITVTSGCTFNVPHEPFANSRPSVTLTGTLDELDDPEVCVKQLQVRAETLVQTHKALLVAEAEARVKARREERERKKREAHEASMAQPVAAGGK